MKKSKPQLTPPAQPVSPFRQIAESMGLPVADQPKPPPLQYLLQAEALAKANERHLPPDRRNPDPSMERPLAKSILNLLNGGQRDSIERLAFERDPSRTLEYAGVFRPKLQLTPNALLKRIAIQDDLIAAILQARANQLGAFGAPPPDRHSTGFKIEPDESLVENLTEEQSEELQNRIDKVTKLLLTCGSVQKVKTVDQMSFSDFLGIQARNALVFGWMATEIIYALDDGGKRVVHSFRPVDAGTVHYAAPYKQAAQSVRDNAKSLLETLYNEKFEKERYEADEYQWIQVIEGRPVQAFTDEELLVTNFFPVTDWELGGYPLTPIDTMLSAITTHINITAHNKAYFQSGRASRGMLVIKSPDVNLQMVEALRQQFNAAINGVQNAWRMPVFGCGPDDEISWQPIDQGGRDMEFQYLADTNARVILSAFLMSPEELPGYQHLSRGTNNQALSESGQEYKLTAARDVGIRPLLKKFEAFLNDRILPLLDPNVARLCKLKLVGLEADDDEKETVKITQWMPVYGTMNRILEKVELDPIPTEMGGDFPFNEAYVATIEKYLTFGQILEYFFKVKGASQRPDWQFYQNPNWMNWIQMQNEAQMQQQQAQQQYQLAQQQLAAGMPIMGPGTEGEDDGGGGDDGSGGGGGGGGSGGGGGPPSAEAAPAQKGEVTSAIDQLLGSFSKAEGVLTKAEGRRLSQAKRRLKAHHKVTNRHIMDEWEQDWRRALGDIADLADRHKPNK